MARTHLAALLTIVAWLPALLANASDWPQFRHDAGRTAASPESLPSNLELCWSRELPTPKPAFPHELRLLYDESYEPVVLGDTIFVPSMVTDTVTALSTETGEVRWRFFTEGPVRFAPVAWEDKVYFVSDDGYLYCVAANNGTLLWKFRGLPEGETDRKVIGHGRMVSLWPARGGPVLADGVIYFAAGLWPTEGVFVHAVNAETGKAAWSNTECDFIPASNWDHGIGHDSGLTPQGYLAIVGDRLVVPCGAQLPAFLDLKTGELQPYTMGWGGRNGLPKGCWFVAGVGDYLSHGGDLYDISRPSDELFAKTKPGGTDYKRLLYPGGFTRLDTERNTVRELDSFRQPVMTPEAMYESDLGIVARDLTSVSLQEILPEDIPAHRKADPYPDTIGGKIEQIWSLDSDLDVHIKAGDRLYVGGPGAIEAIDLSGPEPKVVWHAKISGTPTRMLAADGKLFVVTDEGTILAFGSPPTGYGQVADQSAIGYITWPGADTHIVHAAGVDQGYALVLGMDSGDVVAGLAMHSNLHVVAVDDDPATVEQVRRHLFRMGLYGSRVSVLLGDPLDIPFSPYFADLVVSETPDELAAADGRSLARTVYHVLRPYGGIACASGELANYDAISRLVESAGLHGATVEQEGDFVLLKRDGALPGAADWSHVDANAAGTGASEDTFIQAPMSILWYDAAQRWHKFPGQNQIRVVGGRVILFEEGVLRASDVYTGRTLWEKVVPFGVNPLADLLQRDAILYARHREWGPKPSLLGSTQLVVADDAIYLCEGTRCLVFDPATGQQRCGIDLPEDIDGAWSNLRISGGRLIAGCGANVLCYNRNTGNLLWRTKTSSAGLSLAVGADKVFCSELPNPRRGEGVDEGSLFALKLETGEQAWRRAGGAPLRYAPAQDVVVTTTGFYHAATGEPLDHQPSASQGGLVVKGRGLPESGLPGYIAGDKLLTGNEENLIIHDIASCEQLGQPLKWTRRGCTGTRASTHLLTTRYRGNSAWIDLKSGQITPLLGIRPACQVNNNLYPANGVLNIPALTAGCTCNYAPLSTACVPADVVLAD